MSFKDLDADSDDTPVPKSERLRPLSVRRPAVLVIEDDVAASKSIEFLLAPRYRVILCASVSKGLDALNDDVHAVVLDVKLKGQSKFGACEQIRKAQPDVPIILYAARGNAEEASGAVSQHKPFGYVGRDNDPQKLLDALDLATRLYQTTQRSRRLLEKLRRGRPPTGQ